MIRRIFSLIVMLVKVVPWRRAPGATFVAPEWTPAPPVRVEPALAEAREVAAAAPEVEATPAEAAALEVEAAPAEAAAPVVEAAPEVAAAVAARAAVDVEAAPETTVASGAAVAEVAAAGEEAPAAEAEPAVTPAPTPPARSPRKAARLAAAPAAPKTARVSAPPRGAKTKRTPRGSSPPPAKTKAEAAVEPMRPLGSKDAMNGSVWLPRILWALEFARRHDLGPQSASDISRLLVEKAGLKVPSTNVARAFRDHKAPGQAAYWTAIGDQRYEISGAGREALDQQLRGSAS